MVQLFINGVAAGIPTTASGLSVAVGLGATVLTPGQQVTATQSLAGKTSVPSPFPETVSAAPSAATGLPAVVFLSGLHPCIDWAMMGGTIPGRGGGDPSLGPARRIGRGWRRQRLGAHSVPNPCIRRDTLEALQSFTPAGGATIKGGTVPSLPLQAAPPGEPPAPTVQPPLECDMAVLVSGMNEGVSLVVKHNADELAGYPFVGTPVWASLVKPARGPDQLSAKQQSAQCGRTSGFSAPVGVNPGPKLPTPVILGPICPNALMLRVRSLRPGATVTIFGETQAAGGSSASAQIGQARAWATDCDFALPPNWANHPQLTATLVRSSSRSFQENCDKGSDTAKHPVAPLPGLVGQPGMTKPVECARVIAANTLTPGAVVVVHSDQADSPVLSGPVFVTASNMSLGVYRPLRAHEHVQLKQVGCNAASDSASTEVDPFPGIVAPIVVGPVRIPHGGINLKKLVVGARVHIFVDAALKVSFDATASSHVHPGAGADTRGGRRRPSIDVHEDLGREQSRVGAVRRVAGESFTVTDHADQAGERDREREGSRDRPACGWERQDRRCGCWDNRRGLRFYLSSGAAPASTVDAPNHKPGAIGWNLVDPPPQPPAMLQLSIANQAPSFFTVTAVTWNILRQELNGTLTPIASPTGQSVAVHPPTNGQYHVHAEVSVDDHVNGGNILAEFRGNVVVGGVSRLVVVWSNVNHAQNFRLFAEPVVVWGGGTAVTVYNPVVAV